MSESQSPVAATIQEIKRAFPKAKAEFIVKCMEQQMPMPDVAALAVDETMTENAALMARVQALETEMAAMKAKAALEVEVSPEEPSEEEPVAKAEADEEAKSKAMARRTGAKPVAKSNASGKPSARLQWNAKINEHIKSGTPAARASVLVNRENPGLRQQMLDEVNV